MRPDFQFSVCFKTGNCHTHIEPVDIKQIQLSCCSRVFIAFAEENIMSVPSRIECLIDKLLNKVSEDNCINTMQLHVCACCQSIKYHQLSNQPVGNEHACKAGSPCKQCLLSSIVLA